jgi:hypothetical protein
MRTFDRPVWVLLLVFTNVVGGLLRLCIGRSERRQAAQVLHCSGTSPG